MIEVYNSLAVKNEDDKFVSNLILGMGYPMWNKSFIYENKKINEDLILIPLVKGNDTKVSGIITATRVKQGRYEGEYIINAMSRNVALGKGKNEVNNYGRCSYLKGFRTFDKAIFSFKDSEIEEEGLACGCNEIDNPPSVLTGGDCMWSVVTVCSDTETQVTWVATTSRLPPHLDHDRDGIPNEEDQDWYEFSQRHDINQDEFEQIIGDWWEQIDYDQYEFDNDQYLYDEFLEDLYNEFMDDRFPEENPNDDDDQPQCCASIFDDWGLFGGDALLQGDTRDIICNDFYVLICGDEAGGPNWQDFYTEVVLCDDCEDLINSQDAFRDRLLSLWNDEGIDGRMGFSSFLNIVGSNGSCDALSPGFESCALGALALHDLEEFEAYGYITLTEDEKEHIMSFEPLLAVDILDFLQVNAQNPMAAQAVHDLIALQSCSSGGENCVVTNYQNNLAIIQTLYGNLSDAEFLSLMANDQVRLGIVAGVLLDNDAVNQVSELIAFINTNGLNLSSDATSLLLLHPVHRPQVTTFYENHPDDLEAEEYLNDQLSLMLADPAYQQSVESMINLTPAMWAIAKELIGDKIVQIVGDLVLGGQKQNVLDAIKAAKNGDYFGVVYEAIQLVGNQSPLGKAIKAAQAAVEFSSFMVKLNRIWDKIGGFTEEAITRLWNIAKNSPLKASATYLKYVGDLATPRLGHVDIPDPMPVGFWRYNVFRGNFSASAGLSKADFDNLQVHHAVPQWVLTRHPNLGITPNQMHSLENLRGIPNGTLDHTTITNYWEAFSNSNPNPDMDEILDYVKFIDDEFGHLMIPPVR